MLISKSEYMMFLRHPAWLWLKKHDPSKLPAVSENTQAMFDAGNLFETYAEKLFPSGIRLGFKNYNEYLSLPGRTQKVLENGAKTIFQGRFEHSQLTFICDVIQLIDHSTIDLYEIKSSTKVKPVHEFDLAFQMVVLELCGYNVRSVSVIHVNNQFVRNGDINPADFTEISEITDEVKSKREQTLKHIAEALKVAKSTVMPNPSPSFARLGSLGEWIDIYRGLVQIAPDSIYDLHSPYAERLGELEKMHIKNIIDIPDDFPLTEKQRLQIQTTKSNKEYIDVDTINDYLNSFTFPLYFLDYETLGSVVPYFDGMRSYQQLPFQYSLHILESPDAELKHFGYLHQNNSNPAKELSNNLASQIGKQGSIITWNASFEKSCNTLLGSLLPKYKAFYENMNSRISDLMIPFSNSWYVNRNFNGSASIKNVLPVLAPDLSYKDLGIQDGGTAQRLWMSAMLFGSQNVKKEEIIADLLKYCSLDTLAMVKIYKHLVSI